MLLVNDDIFATVQGVTIDRAAAEAHIMRPINTVGVQGLTDQTAPSVPTAERVVRAYSPTHRFDYAAFADGMGQALPQNLSGFYWEIQHNGVQVITGSLGSARIDSYAFNDQALWNSAIPAHIASCSKLVTAMAMTKVLAEHNIGLAQPIAAYLPTYWTKGPGVGPITFRQLMTHRSGFATGTSQSDYAFMKQEVADGVPGQGAYQYENMNFGLCRILLAVINGDIAKDTVFPVNNDAIWDLVTINAYQSYCQTRLFAPAGVTDASLQHPHASALAYSWPLSIPGWDSGDMSTMSGGCGWHMSALSLLQLMRTFRRGGKIVGETQAQAMLDAGIGIDGAGVSTPLGLIQVKNGKWKKGSGATQQTEQALAYFLPGDIELVAFANSRYGAMDANFRDAVTKIVVAAIKPI